MKKSVITLLIILALTAALLFAAFNGIGSIIPRTQDGIVLGLDLVGGSEITYEAQVTDTSGDLSEGMKSAIAMLRQRLDTLGYTEANAYQAGDRQIVVEIPSISDPVLPALSPSRTPTESSGSPAPILKRPTMSTPPLTTAAYPSTMWCWP